MFVSDCLGLNALGHLTIGGRDTVELAQTYGTPLYVMDEDEIRELGKKAKRRIRECYTWEFIDRRYEKELGMMITKEI